MPFHRPESEGREYYIENRTYETILGMCSQHTDNVNGNVDVDGNVNENVIVKKKLSSYPETFK